MKSAIYDASSVPILGTVFLACFMQGCISARIPERALLENPLPQHHFLPFQVNEVWEAMLAEAIAQGREVVAQDEKGKILSWIAEIQRDRRLHASLDNREARSRRGKTIGITVIRAKAVSGGCRLTIRQIYYRTTPPRGISQSRGNYEAYLLGRILQRLRSGDTGAHELSAN